MKIKNAFLAIMLTLWLLMFPAIGQEWSGADLENKDSFSNVLEVEAQT